MTVIESELPIICMASVLVAVLTTILLRQNRWLSQTLSILVSLVTLGCICLLVDLHLSAATVITKPLQIVTGLALYFKIDGSGLLLAIMAVFLWAVTSLYTFGYFQARKLENLNRFLIFFALSIFVTLGVAFAGNLLTLYLFYELLSLLTYPLVCHEQSPESRAAGRKYIAYTVGSSLLFVLPALIIIYSYAGSLDFTAAGILNDKLPNHIASIVFLLLLFGFSKAAIMPLHGWLPAAMVAPTPVSSLLHAVAVVKVGVFSIFRIVTGIYGVDFFADLTIFNWPLNYVVGLIVSCTIILASLIALRQDNLKARLAYSTIGQLSYIVLGLAMLVPQAIQGAALHMLMHGFGKITLFFCAGLIYIASGKKYISQMHGLGRQLPFLAVALFVGAVTVVGLPPTGGFISKWLLISGTIAAEQYFFTVVYLCSSILAAYYLIGLAIDFTFGAPDAEQQVINTIPWPCYVALFITGLGSVLLFFNFEFFVGLLQ